MKKERYRVIGNYTATMTIDVMAENMQEAEKKARDVFESADADDFSIGDEIDVEAYKLYGDEKESQDIMNDMPVMIRHDPAIGGPVEEGLVDEVLVGEDGADGEIDVAQNNDTQLYRVEDAEFEVVNNPLLP